MQSIKQFLRAARNGGYAVWVAYGQVELIGYVLRTSGSIAEIQDQQTGAISQVALSAIEEAVEA